VESDWAACWSVSLRSSARNTEVVSAVASGMFLFSVTFVSPRLSPDAGLAVRCDVFYVGLSARGVGGGPAAGSGLRDLGVPVRVQSLLELPLEVIGVRDLQDDDPALAVRVGVDQFGRGLERGVDLHDLSGERRVQVRDALRRLDLTEGLTGLGLAPHIGELHKDDVPELGLSVLG